MKIQFWGAARTVTGSKHMLYLPSGKKMLLDCGMFQGVGKDTDPLNREFPFDAASISYLILSHAHIDHSGSIPTLVKRGFRGQIFCTPATRDLCEVMLADSAHIQENDARFMNKKRGSLNLKKIQPLYSTVDVSRALHLFQTIPYDTVMEIEKGVRFHYTDSGHILGSAAVNLEVEEKGKTHRIFFSGDIGRYHDRILRAPQNFLQAEYIITESTYGNRLHEKSVNAEERLVNIVKRTLLEKKGKLIIPAFSLGRTQELVYTLDSLQTRKVLPPLKVYVDSPLSTSATDIMRRHRESYNAEILEYIKTDPDPFNFPGLRYVKDAEESKSLNSSGEPCIIISASGMAESGRIKHHIRNNIGNAKNTILIVGYCSPQSLGGKLSAGDKKVNIFGEPFDVRAEVEVLSSYSAHADYEEMLRYFSCQDKKAVKRIFLVHGEYPVQLEWREKLLASGFSNIDIPEPGSTFNTE
jgi:metallo-beta-lactamase family protein